MTAALLLWSPENRHGEASPSAGVCLSRSCRVDKQKLFSVLFCSGMMLLYFFGTLYDRAKSRRGLALLLQSFIRAPHIEPVSKLSHFRGHSYMIQLEQDVLSAKAGKRSEAHKSEPQSLMSITYAVFCLKQKKQT